MIQLMYLWAWQQPKKASYSQVLKTTEQDIAEKIL
jgi:hypothetical protein